MCADFHSHIGPEPIEAPEPQETRQRDLRRYRALLRGWRVLSAQPGPPSFLAFTAAVDAYEEWREFQSALDEVR
jgi:hypothetical protein